MPKTAIVPCTKEEMSKIVETSMEDEFYYTLFMLAKKTGRRLGEYYEVQVQDIDFERGVMMTKVLKKRKKVEKEAILDSELIFLLKSHIRNNQLKLNDYLEKLVTDKSKTRLIIMERKQE